MMCQVGGLSSASHLLVLELSHARGIVGHDHDVATLLVVSRHIGGWRVPTALTRFTVFYQHWHGHPPWRLLLLLTGAVLLHLLLGHFVLCLSLHLIPVVLKPDFHLRGR